ncbi:DUF2339 domain-containing protein [Thermoflexibacter ruber]|uniref:Predicted membrane protein n=1 Tax=Thermoflexibacter ruber TaxID=1003 RepID=A0A1I2JJR6_9BACT|nr:DUF2339 domain-containing protein [Thermoflexibacter ruber]SFF54834.1 Predicted membrane protein [Thermoflexibacter ruber]
MAINEDELEQIKTQISQLEKYFFREIAYLKAKVTEMENQLEKAEIEENIIPKTESSSKDILEVLKQFQEREKNKAKQETVEQKSVHQTEKNITIEVLRKRAKEEKAKQKENEREQEQQRESSWEVPAFVTDLFMPLAQFRDLFTATYQHYKAQNRLPVFFMTLGGVIAILLGFTYLMQFIPDIYFETFKVGGGFLASFGILFSGVVLLRKEQKYHEFGSALLGLSIAINFLILYYLSDSKVFPIFANPIVSFILILLNTAFAKWLALRYETKIVLTISFLGGVFSPFYLSSPATPVFYFAYLWLLCVAAIFIASKIKWQIGDFLVFITASIALEIAFSSLVEGFPAFVYTLIVMAFAYLFFYVSLFENKKPKENLERLSIAILAGAGSLLLYQLFWFYEALGQRFSLGLVYLGNAVIFLVGYFGLRKQLSEKMQVLFFIIIGTFTALAVPVMLERNIAGIFWAVEAIALIFCGFNFNLSGVRKEGYLILAIALGQISLSFREIIDSWGVRLWTDGFINLLSLGVIFGVLKLLLMRYKADEQNDSQSDFLEKNINYWLSEAIPLWLGFAIWIPCYFLFRELTFNLAILGLYGFTWWGLKNKLAITEWFGILHIGLLALGIRESILVVNSFIFPFQTPLGKTAIIEVFASLWILQFFYEKINPQAHNLWLMKLLREVFYLLVPLLHLSYINRVYPEYLPIALWATVLVGFILNELVKRNALLLEIHLFTIIATLGIFTALGDLQIGYLSALSGAVVLFGVLIYKKGFVLEIAKTSPYRLLFTYSFYYLGLCLWLYYFVLTSANFLQVPEVSGTFFVVGLYYLVLTYFKNKIAPLHNNFLFAFRIGMLAGLIGLLIAFIDKELMIDLYDSEYENMGFVLMLTMVTIFGLLTYQKDNRYPCHSQVLWQIDLFFTHIFIALAYSSLIGYFTPNWTGVWLTVVLILHAIILLFNSNSTAYKPLLRLSIAYFAVAFVKLFWRDMAGFETVQKVVVFMVIGVLMLAGSYFFMRFREKSK